MRSGFAHIGRAPGALASAAGCLLARCKRRRTERHRRSAHPVPMVTAACGLAALLIGCAIGSQASGQTLPQPAFAEASCDLPHVSPEIRPRLRCGTVSVPRNHEHPESGSFRLAVVVIRSQQQPAAPDPLVYVSGGPGSPLTIHAQHQATHPVAPGRDIILVDQRGMGRSEPAICPDQGKDLVTALAMAIIETTAETLARRRAIFRACRDAAIASGIDLRDFGTAVTVRDFDTVRRALGVQRWDLFGVSYGTTVAMTLMAHYPDTVRSAVLDSVYPPDPILPLSSVIVPDARAAFLAACDGNRACAAAYPDLAALYRETKRRLDLSPPALVLPPGLRDPARPGRLTAALFELVISRLVYYPNLYPGLPRLIASAHDGDTTLFAQTLAALFAEASNPDTGMNVAANAAVECRDRPRYHQSQAEDADILDQIALHDVCGDWVDPGAPPVIPVGSGIPTLVLAGQFDPNARPASSRHVAGMIGSQARWVEFPLAGHSVRAFSPCASMIVAAFVDHPTEALDTACASQPPPIRFLPRRRTP